MRIAKTIAVLALAAVMTPACSAGAVTSYRDVPYASNRAHKLDIYLPTRASTVAVPVIVFIHGGAWRARDKSDSGAMRAYTSAGFAGVSINYRLSGDAIWPAQIHDAKAAIRWVRANASKYGFDSDRISVMGRSAGAHLALLLATTGTELEGSVGRNLRTSSEVRCVANLFGPTDLEAMIGTSHGRLGSPESDLLGAALNDSRDLAREASPVTYITADDPPVFTMHGTADNRVPVSQAKSLHRKLVAAGVWSRLVLVPDGGHGGWPADGEVVRFLGNKCK